MVAIGAVYDICAIIAPTPIERAQAMTATNGNLTPRQERFCQEYAIDLTEEPENGAYDVIVIAVGHDQFKAMGADGIRAFGKPNSLVYDIKYVLPAEASDERL